MSTIANIYTGNSINETEKQKKYVGLPEGYNYIATKDVSFEYSINYENGVKIPFNETNFRVAYKNTPLLCIEGGSAGRKIAILEQDVCFGNKLCAFQSLGVNPKYLYYYLQNPLFIQVFKSKTTGIIGGVSVNTLKTLIFALPPLSEQARIVEEIERFEPLLTEYDRLQQQATKLDDEIYDKLKKSILQYAIQGKLVEQDENDKPASTLLERIRAEKKAQLGKKYVESYIYKGDDNCYYEHIDGKDINITDEIPFDLPENWCWSRFEQTVEYTTDYVANGSFASLKENVKVYKSVNYALMIKTQDFANNFSFDLTYTDKKGYEFLSKSALYGGELMLSNIGASIGKAFIIPHLNIPMTIAPNSIVVKCFNDVTTNYLKILMLSFYGQQVLADFTAGTAMPKFSKTQLRNLLIPIPPIAEQKRIVDKSNEIFAKL